ncbi:MAG: hypothetical protein WC554_09610 [Clostridia bacterium]
MEKLTHSVIIEKSKLYLNLSKNLLNRIDLFLCNTDLSNSQKETIIKLLEESYNSGYENALMD